MATIGEVPPSANKGQNFIHDPRVRDFTAFLFISAEVRRDYGSQRPNQIGIQ